MTEVKEGETLRELYNLKDQYQEANKASPAEAQAASYARRPHTASKEVVGGFLTGKTINLSAVERMSTCDFQINARFTVAAFI